MALPLAAIAAESHDGHILLCNASKAYEICDLVVPRSDSTAMSSFEFLPVECLFPHFRRDGRLSCFERTGDGIEYLTLESDGRRSSTRFPERWLPDQVVIVGEFALISKRGHLYRWDRQQLVRLPVENVRWIDAWGDDALVASCGDHQSVSNCSIQTIGADLALKTIWQAKSSFPTAARQVSQTELLVDFNEGGVRHLVIVDPSDEDSDSRAVWSRSVYRIGSDSPEIVNGR